jgi:A/G-specific adenine glycosylase
VNQPPGDLARTRALADTVLRWYASSARDLPWRRADAGAWAVLVSEVMLQQTPVARVLPEYLAWMERWPTPSALAQATAGDAVRMWGKLGYPRRALRLHACAVAITAQHGGEVPADLGALLALPGVGEYTARAVASFAFRQRHPVVDTNVRRVVARAVLGQGDAGPPSTTRDLAAMEPLMPLSPERAARFAVAMMELGALVCTARSPQCGLCPLRSDCAWLAAGSPPYDGPRRAGQRFEGTDRQVRGRLLDVLRAAESPVPQSALDACWAQPVQRNRALGGLIADGLIDPLPDGTYALPGHSLGGHAAEPPRPRPDRAPTTPRG